jgi:hypothetical protein
MSWSIAALGQVSGTRARGLKPTHPSVRAATRAFVNRALGVAEKIAMCWTALTITRITLSLSLFLHLPGDGLGCYVLVTRICFTARKNQ